MSSFISQLERFAAAAAKSLQSCPTLCNPTDVSPPGSSVPGIFQARELEWLPFPSPGDLSDPGIEPVSPALAGEFFYLLIHQGSPIWNSATKRKTQDSSMRLKHIHQLPKSQNIYNHIRAVKFLHCIRENSRAHSVWCDTEGYLTSKSRAGGRSSEVRREAPQQLVP